MVEPCTNWTLDYVTFIYPTLQNSIYHIAFWGYVSELIQVDVRDGRKDYLQLFKDILN